jgi:DNA-binding CsgD family transcriptional regulator
MGRLKPTEDKPIGVTDNIITLMLDRGITQGEIAAALAVDHRTLRKYYPNDSYKPGKPMMEVDYATLERVAGVGCTDSEIAVCMGMEVNTHLSRIARDAKYANAIKIGREKVKKELRELRWNLAKGIKDIDGKWIEKPNTAMIFRLSRELLGERDFNGATAVEKKEEIIHKFDFGSMSIDELKAIKSTISKLKEKNKLPHNGSTAMEVHNNIIQGTAKAIDE